MTSAPWADDWLTPDEARALRAAESMPRPITTPAPRKPLTIDPRAARRTRRSRIVQRIARAAAWTVITGATLGLWYIACKIAWVLSAH